METVSPDLQHWRDVSVRMDRLEVANGDLKRRTLIAVGLNALVLLSLACWLVWPGKSLTTRKLTAHVVDADEILTPHAALRPDGLTLVSNREPSSIHLSTADPDAPTLSIQNDERGRFVASVADAPFIGLYAGSRDGGPGGGPPQIELSLAPEDRSPRIVLRDVHGTVIWHAP
jgi:hypothetical protein